MSVSIKNRTSFSVHHLISKCFRSRCSFPYIYFQLPQGTLIKRSPRDSSPKCQPPATIGWSELRESNKLQI